MSVTKIPRDYNFCSTVFHLYSLPLLLLLHFMGKIELNCWFLPLTFFIVQNLIKRTNFCPICDNQINQITCTVKDVVSRCTSWSSPCNGWPRSTQAWCRSRGRCCRRHNLLGPKMKQQVCLFDCFCLFLMETDWWKCVTWNFTCTDLYFRVSTTLVWISILRMEPMMHNVSLTMMRMYQPFRNSNLSDQETTFPQWFLQ